MNFIDDIKDNSLLIVPSNIKEKVLDYINNSTRLINTKIISFNELKKELLFEIDPESNLLLMSKYNYKKEVIDEYISNMYYIDNNDYGIDKLKTLISMKEMLIDNNLIIKHSRLLNFYKDKNVYVYGYDYIDKFNQSLLDNFNNVKIINKTIINNTSNVYEFNTLDEEIYFVLSKVVELIDNNVPLEKIVICNTDENYEKELYKLFNMCNININIDKNSSIMSSIIGRDIINKLDEYKDLEKTLEYFKEAYDLEDEYNSKMYAKVLSIFNRYYTYDYDFNIAYECIKNDFNKEKLSNSNDYGIRLESFSNNHFNSDEYVFLVGFNEGIIPRIHKDEEFLSDKIKSLLNLDESITLNSYEKESLLSNIKSIKNLYITYKHKYKDEEFYKSSLIDDIELINIKENIDYSKSYSKTYSGIKLSSMLDDLIKYGNKSDYLNELYNSIEIPYREYDNKYTNIDYKELKEYLNNEINLSYSSINEFYKCSFKYYLENILNLNIYEDNFNAYIGSLFHFVLSNITKRDFDIDRLWNNYIKDKELSSKEEFYLNKLKKELYIIVDFLKEFEKDTGLTETMTEKPIEIDVSDDLNVIFKGFVDKIMYKEYNGETLASIIDYKTGDASCDIRDNIYGLNLQLPVYLYLVSKKNLLNNFRPVGFYLQRILNSEVKIVKDKTYLEQKYDNLKLNGYSTNNITNLSRFDPTYEDSKYIMSMKTKKDGDFNAYAKVLTEEEMNNLVDLIDKKIHEVVKEIENTNFKINPKKLSTDKEDEITGCKYCKYNDICFRRSDDIKNITKQEDLSFLESGV